MRFWDSDKWVSSQFSVRKEHCVAWGRWRVKGGYVVGQNGCGECWHEGRAAARIGVYRAEPIAGVSRGFFQKALITHRLKARLL